MLPRFIAKTAAETRNLYYDFTINGEEIFCREAYEGAEGLLEHLKNVEQVLAEYLALVDLVRVEVHGSAEELAKLRQPLANLRPQWFEFQDGVVRE